MNPRLSGHISIFGVVLFVLKSLLGIARKWSRESFGIYFYNISFSWLLPLNGFQFIFLLRDSENDLLDTERKN